MTGLDQLFKQYNEIQERYQQGRSPTFTELADHHRLKAQECERLAGELGIDTPYGRLAAKWGDQAKQELERIQENWGLTLES